MSLKLNACIMHIGYKELVLGISYFTIFIFSVKFILILLVYIKITELGNSTWENQSDNAEICASELHVIKNTKWKQIKLRYIFFWKTKIRKSILLSYVGKNARTLYRALIFYFPLYSMPKFSSRTLIIHCSALFLTNCF